MYMMAKIGTIRVPFSVGLVCVRMIATSVEVFEKLSGTAIRYASGRSAKLRFRYGFPLSRKTEIRHAG